MRNLDQETYLRNNVSYRSSSHHMGKQHNNDEGIICNELGMFLSVLLKSRKRSMLRGRSVNFHTYRITIRSAFIKKEYVMSCYVTLHNITLCNEKKCYITLLRITLYYITLCYVMLDFSSQLFNRPSNEFFL